MNSMLPPLESANPSPVIHLPPHATTVTAEDLHVRLVLAADDGATTIDASASESIGQAALQVLLAARIEARDAGQEFHIIDPSPAFLERIEKCGLADAIGLTKTIGDQA
ncbi:STAS domain-containing protein [Sphingomonas sp.]|jgi:anti-anti-sigma regulatory factor|uniref:STAS domain-containing protein n=1 Tax=Sphingomonas sp. TaxID=28214 RepID=UPI00356A09C8